MSNQKLGGFLLNFGKHIKSPKPLTVPGYPTQELVAPKTWSKVSVGKSHVVAITDDNTGSKLFAWGNNPNGAVGITRTNELYNDKQYALTDSLFGILGAGYIREDGVAFYSGYNAYGNLGNLTTTNRSSPVQVGTAGNHYWKKLSISQYHALGIKTDGTLWAWGSNPYGSLGDNTITSSNSPVFIDSGPWKNVEVNNNYGSYGIKENGTMWAWGYNNYGQLGDNFVLHRSSPVQIGAFASDWKQVSAGAYHAAAVRDNGLLYTWGYNNFGQLGQGNLTHRSSPVQVSWNNYSWIQVTAHDTYTMHAIRYINNTSNGRLYGWGYNNYGQVGDNTTITRSSPTLIGGFSWTKISDGEAFTIGIRTDGTLWSWGIDNQGQLAQDVRGHRSSPVQIGNDTWSDVYTNIYNTVFGIRSDNNLLYGWGRNDYGQLGTNHILHRSSPVQVTSFRTDVNFPAPILPTQSWNQISSGKNHTLAINSSSKLYGWGDKAAVDGSINYIGFREVSNKGGTAAGIKNDNTLWTWGYSVEGQTGYNDVISKSSPVQIAGSWNKVFVGNDLIYAYKTDGSLWGWGYDPYATIGTTESEDYSKESYSHPVQIRVRSQTDSSGVSWRNIANGANHTIAVKSDGTLWASGYNLHGQLGDNTTIHRSSPVQIGSGSNWTNVGAGSQFSYASTDTVVFSWGQNDVGQLGDNSITHRSSPVQVSSVSSSVGFKRLQGGNKHGMFLSNGSGTCWSVGLNNQGQLGQNNTTNRSVPGSIGSGFVEVVAGAEHSAAVKTDGNLYTWGQGSYGQLGHVGAGSISASFTEFVKPFSGTPNEFTSWTQISVGDNHTGGLRSDGVLFTWGYNNVGQLGDGTTVHRSSPVQVATSVSRVACGNAFTHYLNTSGTIYSTGTGSSGQLGNLTTTNVSNWVTVSGGTGFADVYCGPDFSIGRKTNNTIWHWGSGSWGTGGINNVTSKSSPVQIGGTWLEAKPGYYNVLGIKTDGTLWAWGYSGHGELGLGDTLGRSSPVQVGSDTDWTHVATKSTITQHTVAVKSDGTMWAWGYNNLGQLGHNDRIHRSSPVQIGSDTDWSMAALGNSRTQAIKTDGSLWGWGSNPVGDGTSASKSSPVQIGTSESWSMINSSSGSITFGITSNNQLYVFGSDTGFNTLGYAGSGTTTNASSPTQVGPSASSSGKSWVSVGSGTYHSSAVKSDGTLWAWGHNPHGQLGQNNTIHRSSPVQIGSDTDWASTSIASSTTYGIKRDGSLYSWGYNGYGSVGDNSVVNRSSPVQVQEFGFNISPWKYIYNQSVAQTVTGLNDEDNAFNWGYTNEGQVLSNAFLAISRSSPIQIGSGIRFDYLGNKVPHPTFREISISNAYFRVAISEDNKLFTWGLGSNGQTGHNDVATRRFPMQLGNDNWSKVSAGQYHALGIKADGTLWTWGWNRTGQLGQNNIIHRSSPVQIGSDSWSQISASYEFSLGIKTDGTLWAWGQNNQGQLGQNDQVHRSSPVQIGSATDWTVVKAGVYVSFAKNANNELYAWGHNNAGQLGDGTTVTKSSPVQVASNLEDFSDKFDVWNYFMGITNNSSILYGWGTNNVGQLAQNNITSKSTAVVVKEDDLLSDYNVFTNLNVPTQIGNLNYKSIEAGNTTSYAINTNDRLYAWGVNERGQLGHNEIDDKVSPVQVGTDSWNEVVTGDNFTIAKKN